jgi:uncharacterized coiled-coil protein SlyX
MGLLAPNTKTTPTKPGKEEVEEALQECLINSPLSKRLQTLESQVKVFPDMINNLNKQILKLHKESDTQNLVYQCQGLQEYIKKEILILNNRLNSLELLINQMREEKRRPSSASKMSTNYSNDSKLNCSVSFKKLTPAPSCISCYCSSQLVPTVGNKRFTLQNLQKL